MRRLRGGLLWTTCLTALFGVAGPCAAAEGSAKAGPGRLSFENRQLRVAFDTQTSAFSVVEKAHGYRWQQLQPYLPAEKSRPRNVKVIDGPKPGVSFEADYGWSAEKTFALRVTLQLADDAPELLVAADAVNRDAPIEQLFPFLMPLIHDSPQGAMVLADYTNGHLIPLDMDPFAKRWNSASRLDMPWIGLCDLRTGHGYALLVETCDDAHVECKAWKAGTRQLGAPQVMWAPSKKKLSYTRRLVFRFFASGGYVAQAKWYRQVAAKQCLVVPFSEKLKKNPNIAKLFGAPDVWGDATLEFAKAAKAAGVEKMLIHGRPKNADEMKAVNQLGYLTSEYDNYTDVLPIRPGKDIDALHDRIPESVVLKADGKRMTAWLTFDKKEQFMKRCPALWKRTAEKVVSDTLAKWPFGGRFIDVTTAEDLYECYDPAHPLSHSDKRQCGVSLLGYVRSRGLVTGGEHGIWWAVPHLDYIEGMMSGGSYSWPAGHLIRPLSKTQSFTSPWGEKLGGYDQYERWGLGHAYRVPLWELVFHDCIVSTWYWGDSSDFLLAAAPEATAKKDAYNILYGTMPMMWASREGSWRTHRDVFLRTYRNVCKLHEAVAGAELVDHAFLTDDRTVQRTRFADGTEAIVNFGAAPYDATLAGKSYRLPQNGFAVVGPKVQQSMVLEGDKRVTTIAAPGYNHRETTQ